MAWFKVKLINEANPRDSKYATVEALTSDGARETAAIPGWRPLTSESLTDEELEGLQKRRKKKKLSKAQLEQFATVMSFMLEAKVGLADAIRFYAIKLNGKRERGIQEAFMGVIERLKNGAKPSVAFEKSELFEKSLIGLIEAGDNSDLGRAFGSVAHFTRQQLEIQAKLIEALAKPAIVTICLLGIFIVAQCLMVPMAEESLKEFDVQPSPMNQVFFTTSHVVQATWPFFVSGVIGLSLWLAFNVKLQRAIIEWMMKWWKNLHQTVMGIRQARVFGTFAMLYKSGMEARKCLPICASVVAGTRMEAEITKVYEAFKENQSDLATAFETYTGCDPVVPHMIGIGVKTGILDVQLEYLAQLFEKQTIYAIGMLTGVITNVAMIAGFAALIFTFAGSYMPILTTIPQLMENV